MPPFSGLTQSDGSPYRHPFFGLGPADREDVLLEPFFLLGYYFGMNWETYYFNLPVAYKKWLIGRIEKEIKMANGNNNPTPSKAAQHMQDPGLRAMSGKHRPQTPAKLKRFT